MMWGAGWGWIWMLISWGVVIALVVWAVHRFSDGGQRQHSSGRQILDERLARGEIDVDEYRRLRDELDR